MGKKLKTILILLFVFGYLDFFVTIFGIESRKLYEVNPIGKALFSLGYLKAFVVFSFILLIFGLVIYYSGKKFKFKKIHYFICLGFFVIIRIIAVINNFYLIFIY